ncbi:AMP-binding protein [Xanthobacter sp. 126]|uniref:class I adenylate-forming enzyme family protein n=1 Tax=Xanthobacter sp. 126 TaxID=1131814 RepID=UPI0004B55C39|nr:AMP-binding protein [Xanthobacter sp. 126]
MNMVMDWIAHHAINRPDRLAAVDCFSQRRYTYADFHRRVDRAASLLHAHGARPGDRVATLCYNSTDLFELQFACQRIGAIYVPLNWRLTPVELQRLVADCAPAVILAHVEFEKNLAAVDQAGAPLLTLNDGGASAYEDWRTEGPPAERALLDSDDTWAIVYTSGSSGVPKGARITYGMTLHNCVHAGMHFDFDSTSNTLTFLPMFHISGLNAYGNVAFHWGGTVHVMRTFDAREALALLRDPQLGISHVLGVPTNYLMMSEQPGFEDIKLPHVKVCAVGGAPCSQTLLETYERGGIVLQNVWGMTETTTAATALSKTASLSRLGSCGRPLLHVELRLANAGRVVTEAGVHGEIEVRGPTITPGYWGAMPRGACQWFGTGDIAHYDSDGYLYLVGRAKDFYISGGENVYCAEVEQALCSHDAISQAAVVAVPHPKWGEVGRAYVVFKKGRSLTSQEVMEHCRTRLAKYKLPQEVSALPEMPLLASGKIDKVRLKGASSLM